jgi:hypothetical protein
MQIVLLPQTILFNCEAPSSNESLTSMLNFATIKVALRQTISEHEGSYKNLFQQFGKRNTPLQNIGRSTATVRDLDHQEQNTS